MAITSADFSMDTWQGFKERMHRRWSELTEFERDWATSWIAFERSTTVPRRALRLVRQAHYDGYVSARDGWECPKGA